MCFVNSKIFRLLLLFCLTSQSLCADILNIGEDSNFSPCQINEETLLCNAYNVPKIYWNKTLNFLKPQRQKIVKVELLDLTMDIIPENFFQAFADDLLSVKIVSSSAIQTIHQSAFSGCKKLVFLEIGCSIDSSIVPLNFNYIFSPLFSLEELVLRNLNIQSLDADHLSSSTNLRSLSIDSPFFNSISTDVFRNNKNITSLTFKGMKNSTDLMQTLETWPMTSKLMLSTINIYNCDVNRFPKLSLAIVENLSQLFLAKNPIKQIGLDEIRPIIKLEVLSLIGTKLDRSSVPGLKLLTNLKDLRLGDVPTLTDLPKEIESMESLELIFLDMSGFVTISVSLPPSIRRVSASFLLKCEQIKSTFLSRCSQLRNLDLTAIKLEDVGFLLANVAVFNNSLNSLSLSSTSVIKGQLFTLLTLLPNLETLFLDKANLNTLPDEALLNLKKLRKLTLSLNSFTYESLNTEGFRTVVSHLRELDLSRNAMTILPPCTFYAMPDMNGLNLQSCNLVCDCQMLWLYETVKKQKITSASLNFTCKTGSNDGKYFYQLNEKDLELCSTRAVESCTPLRSGFYKLLFNVTYNPASLALRITGINGSSLRFMFDYVTVAVNQWNSSIHYDLDKYELTRTSVNISLPLRLSDFEVCLILNRNKIEYKYSWNCELASVVVPVLESRWSIALGVAAGIVAVVVIITVLLVICCRKRRDKKEKDHDYFEASSTQYSEPNDTYENKDQYTYVTNEQYSIEPSEGLDDLSPMPCPPLPPPGIPNLASNLDATSSKSLSNILNYSKSSTNTIKSRFRKRPLISKLISKARSSSNICDRNSVPNGLDAVSMLDLDNTENSTVPRQYVSRALPDTPADNNADKEPTNRPPPKPRLSNSDIRNLLDNFDRHLNHFSQYASNDSDSTGESVNHLHDGDSGSGIPKADRDPKGALNGGSSVII